MDSSCSCPLLLKKLNMKKRYLLLVSIALSLATTIWAQEENEPVVLSGALQTDMLFPEEDAAIGTGSYDSKFLSNSYLDLILNSKYITAGARLEMLQNPLPGFEDDFAGGGIPYLFLTGRYKWAELTVGDIYDQFGSGFILRLYEERSLGISNSLRGGRLVLTPYKGIRFKALGGMQRVYFNYDYQNNKLGFDYSKGAVWGADLELGVEEWIPTMLDNNWRLTLGGSFVSKHEPEQEVMKDPTHKLVLPENVAATDVRARLQKDNWNFLVEYAYKFNDPSKDNGYIYRPGQALLVSAAYSQRGMSALLQVKRSENMAFRSDRTRSGSAAFINHLPAFSMTHTYALPALYPYATQIADGEWAFQGELSYNFKRRTPMGGKYGTMLKLNATYIRGIGKEYIYGTDPADLMGTDGYKSSFFSMGDETYYTDVNLTLDKKITKQWSITAMYMYQIYNQKVVEGHGINGDLVHSNIIVADIKYTPSKNVSMRAELQYLYTKQAEGQWVYGMYELSLFKSLMLYVSDMYNIDATKLHYYSGGLSYNWRSHRLQVAYGRTRAGYNCSGGVCRYVPASRGVTVSYNVIF